MNIPARYTYPIIAMAILMFASTVVFADTPPRGRPQVVNDNLPLYYPTKFDATGVITNIVSTYTWKVDGRHRLVSPNVTIHTLTTDNSSMYSIKKGMNIGYNTNSLGHIISVYELRDGSFSRN